MPACLKLPWAFDGEANAKMPMWVLHMPARLKWARRLRWQGQGEVAACAVAHARPFKVEHEDWLPSSDCQIPSAGDRFRSLGSRPIVVLI